MSIVLHEPTDHQQVNNILCGVIELMELYFPGTVRGYYLDGSYADGCAIDTSDIDVRIVLKATDTPVDRSRYEDMLRCCRLISPYVLDVTVEREEALYRVGAVRFKHTKWLYGEDIRAKVPLKPFADYLHDTKRHVEMLVRRVRGISGSISPPLTYPQAADEFYGYTRTVTVANDSAKHYDNKEIVLLATAIATALVGIQAGQYVLNKRDCLVQYRQYINDEWLTFVEDIFDNCWRKWGYRVPLERQERVLLRQLCGRMLTFENYFLQQLAVGS